MLIHRAPIRQLPERAEGARSPLRRGAVRRGRPAGWCAAGGTADFLLDGSASSDPDSTPGTSDDIVLYGWFDGDEGGAPGGGRGCSRRRHLQEEGTVEPLTD